ncbi:hyaluronidase-1-like [Argonauta hians]
MPLLNLSWILCALLISPGISLPETLYDRPFSVIWNSPSKGCTHHYKKELHLSDYNIIQNTDDNFQGDKMMIYYESQLGLYSFIDSNGKIIRGGIPQLTDRNAHLSKAEEDIKRTIPSKEYIGPAVIDWERWRPTYHRNYGSKTIYKKLSVSNVQKQHPDWNTAEINFEAQQAFTKAARDMFSSTLKLGQKLRPKARWGFYLFPRIYKKVPKQTIEDNDKLGWLFSLSTGLYPDIYLHPGTIKDSYKHVVDTLTEADRIYNKFSDKNRTIVVPYIRYRFDNPRRFYTKQELTFSITIPAVTGSAGVVLWGATANFLKIERCIELQSFVSITLGPFVKHLTDAMDNCSKNLCNGNGRCVLPWDTVKKSELWLNSTTWVENQIDGISAKSGSFQKGSFICQCYTQCTGEHCNNCSR